MSLLSTSKLKFNQKCFQIIQKCCIHNKLHLADQKMLTTKVIIIISIINKLGSQMVLLWNA